MKELCSVLATLILETLSYPQWCILWSVLCTGDSPAFAVTCVRNLFKGENAKDFICVNQESNKKVINAYCISQL